MNKFIHGQLVRLVPQWLNSPDEAHAIYRVVEDNGDRCFIELVCDLPIAPQELVRKEMLVPVEDAPGVADA